MGDIINIGSLAPGQSQVIKCTYKALQSDMGKTNLVNKVDVSSGDITASATSAAANMEAVRYAWTMAKNISNSPANGSEYMAGEDITWTVPITNTGNQNLSVFPLTDSLSGAKITPYDYVPGLDIGKTYTAGVRYTVKESDLSSSTLTNTISGSYKVGSDTKTVSATSSPVKLGVAIPTTQAAFNNLTWAQIAALGKACSTKGTSAYKHMLGFYKTQATSNYGTLTMRLKGFNKFEKAGGYMAGFYFESDEIPVLGNMGSSATTDTPWEKSNMYSTLNTTVYNALPSDMTNEITEVYVQCKSPVYQGSVKLVSNRLFLPSYQEIFGDASSQGYTVEGERLDWYASHTSASDRMKGTGTGIENYWWTRTMSQVSGRNFYCGIILDTGEYSPYQSISTSRRAPICFCVG